MMRMTETVKQLLVINILFFIGTYVIAHQPEMVKRLLALYFPLNSNFHWWQPLTHMFMHGNIMHIFFNMFALISFGSMLEHFWGWKKFLFFYISCGLGAALVHTGMNYYDFQQGLDILVQNGVSRSEILSALNEGKYNSNWETILSPSQFNTFMNSFLIPAVGASGAIYGLLVAFAFMFPNAELMMMFIPVPIKAKYFVPGIVAIDLLLGLKGESLFGGGSGIAHFAHVGGALFGFLLMWYWKKNQFSNNRWN
jgi:membrane associated rhomboid family serine protease